MCYYTAHQPADASEQNCYNVEKCDYDVDDNHKDLQQKKKNSLEQFLTLVSKLVMKKWQMRWKEIHLMDFLVGLDYHGQ